MRLVIVRHGKAEADSPSGRDEDRPLKGRGVRQARWLGEHFAPDPPSLILSSRHERAISTASLIQEATGTTLTLEPRLELGHSPSRALDIIADHNETERALMVVGHNPQLAQLLWILLEGPPVQMADLRTGEAVVLDLDPADLLGRASLLSRVRMPEDD
jgi:phosphohistidine phosphatase